MSQMAATRGSEPRPSDGADGLRLTSVVLIGAAGTPVRADMTLVVDRRGVALSGPGADERVVPWPSVTGWRVGPWQPPSGGSGAVVTYETAQATYRFGVDGADPSALGYLVDQLGRGYQEGRGREEERPPAAEEPSGIEQRVRRLRPVLVVILLVVLAAMVTMILLQSAGVINLPWLGGNGSSGPSGLMLHAARWRA